MAITPGTIRLGAAPARLVIIAAILMAQVLVVGMGWWSGSQNVLTEVVDEYTRRVEASAQDTASGVALAVTRLDIESIEPDSIGSERLHTMLNGLDLPGESSIQIVADDGRELYRTEAVHSSAPTYSASARLGGFNATLTVQTNSEEMLSARDAAASALNIRILLGGAAIIMLTGVVAISLISLHERRLVHANKLLGEAYQSQASDLIAAREGMIVGLAKLADYRDTDTGHHLDRICEYSTLLADAAKQEFPSITDEFIDSLRLASSLHDIGKVGIPDSILLKPGKLTQTERKLIEQHTVFGADTLKSIRSRFGNDKLLDMSIDVAIAHHERWDANGYPNKIGGDTIPLSARIVAIADVYDALTSVRVYKKAMSHEKAVKILGDGRGTQFDPILLDTFLAVESQFNEIRNKLQPDHSLANLNLAA